jgi:hypothetical protein
MNFMADGILSAVVFDRPPGKPTRVVGRQLPLSVIKKIPATAQGTSATLRKRSLRHSRGHRWKILYRSSMMKSDFSGVHLEQGITVLCNAAGIFGDGPCGRGVLCDQGDLFSALREFLLKTCRAFRCDDDRQIFLSPAKSSLPAPRPPARWTLFFRQPKRPKEAGFQE